ncbi:MAG: hypothetical protein IKO72_04085 [Kiritimatiellae bacterium]|nr:hypothetical protein [Kiritimatiellia bacterium]
MKTAFKALYEFISTAMPWWSVFVIAFALSLVLVPLIREMNRRFGMVDQPSSRRINATPIPRGGGLGIFLSLVAVCLVYPWLFDRPLVPGVDGRMALRLAVPPTLLVLLGYADDRFGLPPLVKLAGQIVSAALAVFWCKLGFSGIFPGIPFALDAAFTIFWLVGAINAFNLIDGLDGLATGLSFIAVVGMAGALFCIRRGEMTLLHFALMGSLLGFLRYNFHPASVFLGDCGSMFLGYTVAALPLFTNTSDSFLVGMGIPMLAMGVPIFDTTLAIMRRSVRAVLHREVPGGDTGNGRVMTADTDHLHHRILRRVASQRKAAFILYGFAGLLVLIGLGGLMLKGRAVALFIIGFMAVAYIVFRDMRRIELWDAGRLLNAAVHESTVTSRRRRHLVAVPLMILSDIFVLVSSWLLAAFILNLPVNGQTVARWLVLRAVPIMLAMIVFRAYVTVWSRALLSNYVRLVAAVAVGSAMTGVAVTLGNVPHSHMLAFTTVYAAFVCLGFISIRMVRAAVRDLFYALDAGRLGESSEARRIVVYGAGLRYHSFRRELVRSSAAGDRVIVGLIDDDILLRDQYVGGIRIYGTLEQAPGIIRKLRADAVVIAAVLTPERMAIARQVFASCNVPVTQFSFVETKV